MTKKEQTVWYEMARRKKAFHADKDWRGIKLWGLFLWGEVSALLKRGDLLTDMRKENKTIWVWPSEEAYTKYILPHLDKPLAELERLAGWS